MKKALLALYLLNTMYPKLGSALQKFYNDDSLKDLFELLTQDIMKSDPQLQGPLANVVIGVFNAQAQPPGPPVQEAVTYLAEIQELMHLLMLMAVSIPSAAKQYFG
jgi:hypothetical protein